MGFREIVNLNPIAARIGVAGVFTVAALFAVVQLRDGCRRPELMIADQLFYTADDGATLFADRNDRVPPFQHDGHDAVRAWVFTCDGGKHQWVQYLEKYSDEAKQRLELPPSVENATGGGAGVMSGTVVKKPGHGEKWVPRGDPKARAIVEPKCPDAVGSGPPQPVNP